MKICLIFIVTLTMINRGVCFSLYHSVLGSAAFQKRETASTTLITPHIRSFDRYGRVSNKKLQRRPTTSLFSLKTLVDDIISSNRKQTVFVGGKGGVGKTTTSSALAVQLALQDLKVLVVSSDPAHSLGDALDEDLRRGRGKPVILTDPLTGGRLHASEVNAEAALADFRENLASFDIDRLASSLGVPAELLESLGLREFSGLLNNPPPGLDELVALGNVMGEESEDYDVVLVDTAPTGHTLRLLALPQFLDGLLGKLIKLRMKLSGLTSTLQAFLGDAGAQERARTIDNALDRLETFRAKISNLERKLKDNSMTSFLVVTIPTKLAVEESKRLVSELTSQGIAVNDIVVNQCVGALDDARGGNSLRNYYDQRRNGQIKWVTKLTEVADDVSSSEQYRSNGNPAPIAITKLPFFDVELVGIPALGYIGSQHFSDNHNFKHLMEDDQDEEARVLICGGKGGVGKTTTSSSLAVTMAAKGHKVAIISTDPAHSLGDALGVDLKGGKLVDCPLIGVPKADVGEGSLSAMEIDPSSALSDFKGIVDQLIGGGDGSAGGSDVRATLQELENVFDTLPAGTDEVVALAKVVDLVKKGNFDRIVLDTAPTGHTLRMLSTPTFIAELIDRLLVIADKINSNAAVKMFITSAAGGNNEQLDSAGSFAKSKLISFQLQMYDLEDLFANADQTEFVIVTVPTELAVRESVRLLNDLTFEAPDMPIKVRNIIANQVLSDNGDDLETFLSQVKSGQSTSIEKLRVALGTMTDPPRVTRVPYLDTEPRGVFGLKILADELMRENTV